MSTRRAAKDAPWWWRRRGQSSHHGGGGFLFNQYPTAELPAMQLTAAAAPPLSRPRLRWTTELHEKFVNAVKELGGANNATPKTIRNIMRVDGITLFQIKSHLQKYRLGKIARRALRRNALHADGRRNAEVEEQNVPMVRQSSSEISNMNRDETLEALQIGTHNHLAETTVKNSNPPPPVEASGNDGDLCDYFPEWSGLIDDEDMKPIVPRLNSLGYFSDSAFSSANNLCGSTVMFGSFFDEVEKFDNDVMTDDGFVGMN